MDPNGPIPRHIGIIMDGNARWARRQGRPINYGHGAGVRTVKRIMLACDEIGVRNLSVYAFSTENWTRPRREVSALMRLFESSLRKEIDELDERGIRIVFSGRREGLADRMREQIVDAEARTADNPNAVLNVCLNYGGRTEIVDAVRRLVEDGVAAPRVDEAAIAERLYVPFLPDPDLIIRTAGERRTSNFLLWQSAYAELHVTDVLWPDFGPEDLERAIFDFQSRVRRFGGRPGDRSSEAGAR